MSKQSTLYVNTQKHFTPDMLQRLSTYLDLSVSETQSAFEVIMPSLLMGLAHERNSLSEIMKQDFDGETIMKVLFKNELTNFAGRLELFSHMNLFSIVKMLEMMAPEVMKVLKNIKAENFKDYLADQEAFLAEIVPTDISNYFGYGASNTRMGHVARFVEGTSKPLTSYPKND